MISPHGGKLVSCFTPSLDKSGEKIQLQESEEIDIYNLANGTYSPLRGFCRENEFNSITENIQLTDGTLWAIPVILSLEDERAKAIINSGISCLELHTSLAEHIASLTHIEVYSFNKDKYCRSIFGTTDREHPGVQRIHKMGNFLVGGDIQVLEGWKVHFDDVESKKILNPKETRDLFQGKGFQNIVAFQTRNVPHRGHEYIQKCALENVDALLVHPVIGEKKSGDFQNHVILGSYEILANKYYNPERVILSCLPWVMQYAGPREAIHHAIIRQNFGCSHFIVGRDHAGVGDYYGTYDAQKIFDTLPEGALKIQILRYENAAYCPQVEGVVTDKTSPSPSAERIFISGTKFRAMLTEGIRPPVEFIRKEIADYLLSEKNIFVD